MTSVADGQLGTVRGVGGVTLGEKYQEGVESYLGMLTKGAARPHMAVLTVYKCMEPLMAQSTPRSDSIVAGFSQAFPMHSSWLGRNLRA